MELKEKLVRSGLTLSMVPRLSLSKTPTRWGARLVPSLLMLGVPAQEQCTTVIRAVQRTGRISVMCISDWFVMCRKGRNLRWYFVRSALHSLTTNSHAAEIDKHSRSNANSHHHVQCHFGCLRDADCQLHAVLTTAVRSYRCRRFNVTKNVTLKFAAAP